MDVLSRLAPTIVLSGYDEIREALFNKDLSRSFDRRSYAEGNPGDGTVSTAHGSLQRARRRVENTQFRNERLREYENALFPIVLGRLLDRLVVDRHVDLSPIAPLLSVVLAARRAGLDCDPDSVNELRVLVGHVDAFSQGLGPGILETRDPEAARARVRDALAAFERDFVRPSWERRAGLIERHQRDGTSEDTLPHDILTVLLLHRADPDLALTDDGRIVREVATYLQGGTHSSAQTLLNVLDLLFPLAERNPDVWNRILDDRLFAARCVHESLRLRTITPNVKRRAEADTIVGDTAIPKDALVILDVAMANRDRLRFGEDAETFNPDRQLDDAVPRWGLSFGLGAHQCPGRSSAAGLPVPGDFRPRDGHLYGLVALMLQEMVRRGARPDPDRHPVPDTRTDRSNFWLEFPVVFDEGWPTGR